MKQDKKAMSRWKAAICERVRSIRKQRGLTIDAAAKELGLEAQRYRTYERRSLMPLYYLIQLADKVNMPLDALVRIDGTPPLVVSSEAKFRPSAPRDSRGDKKHQSKQTFNIDSPSLTGYLHAIGHRLEK